MYLMETLNALNHATEGYRLLESFELVTADVDGNGDVDITISDDIKEAGTYKAEYAIGTDDIYFISLDNANYYFSLDEF